MNGRTHRGTGQRYGQNRQEYPERFAAAQLSCNSSGNSSVESRIMVAEEKNTRFERRMKLAYIDAMRRGKAPLVRGQEG